MANPNTGSLPTQRSGLIDSLRSGGIQPDNPTAVDPSIPPPISPALGNGNPSFSSVTAPSPQIPSTSARDPSVGTPAMPGTVPPEFRDVVRAAVQEQEFALRQQIRGEVKALETQITELTASVRQAETDKMNLLAEKRLQELNALPPDEQTRRRLSDLEKELETLRAERTILQEQRKEDLRSFAAFQEKMKVDRYRDQLLVQYGPTIVPELHDTVQGRTEEELLQSLHTAMQRSASLMARFGVGAGVAPTAAPPMGDSRHVLTDATRQALGGYGMTREVAAPTPPNLLRPIPLPTAGIPDVGAGTDMDAARLAQEVGSMSGFDGAARYAQARAGILQSRLGVDPKAGERLLPNSRV